MSTTVDSTNAVHDALMIVIIIIVTGRIAFQANLNNQLTLFTVETIKVDVTAFANWAAIRGYTNASILTRIVIFARIYRRSSDAL